MRGLSENLVLFSAYTDAKTIVFEPHNLESICRAVKSLGDPNIALTLQTGKIFEDFQRIDSVSKIYSLDLHQHSILNLNAQRIF